MRGTEVQGAEFPMFGAWKRPRELPAMVNRRERKEGGKERKKDRGKGRERGRKESGREDIGT